MSNGIDSRQKEQLSIKRLEAQRELYTKAKTYKNISFIFCVLIPCILSLFSLKEKYEILYLYVLISSILLVVFDLKQQKIVNKAANIQLEFDLYVFSMPWSDIFGKKGNLDEEIAKYSYKYRKAKRKQINAWYKEEYDNYELEEGILKCQSENLNWDSSLRTKYLFFQVIASIFFVIIVIVKSILNKESVINVIKLLIMLIAPFNYFIKSIVKLYKDSKECLHIKDLIYKKSNNFDLKYLQIIQMFIQNHRKNNYLIPNWFYYLFAKKEENQIDEMDELYGVK